MEQSDNKVKYAIEFLHLTVVRKIEFRNTEEEVRELVDADPSLNRGDRCVRTWKMSLIDLQYPSR